MKDLDKFPDKTKRAKKVRTPGTISPGELQNGCLAFQQRERRDAMYNTATFLVRHFWGKPTEVAEGLGVLLCVWNHAFYRNGPFDYDLLEKCIAKKARSYHRLALTHAIAERHGFHSATRSSNPHDRRSSAAPSSISAIPVSGSKTIVRKPRPTTLSADQRLATNEAIQAFGQGKQCSLISVGCLD